MESSGLLKGKWALVTGASKGLGKAIAITYAKQGASIALAARSEDKLKDVAEACKKAGAPEVDVLPIDMMSSKSIDTLAATLLERHKCIDVLVNCAGIFPMSGQTPLEGDPDEWDENMQVNLLGPMRLTRRLTPAMAEKKEGYHINISSSAGKHPSPSQCAYSAAKWGMTGFSLSSAKALKEHGIRVVTIFPSMADTPLARKRMEKEDLNPDNMIKPEDVCELVLLPFKVSANAVPQEIVLDAMKNPSA
ncbi:hypothetical protein ABBQ38_011176 [Trebouxia sp. C0009 RCD-2024]